MSKTGVLHILALVLAVLSAGNAQAQGAAPAAKPGLDVLTGAWVRPDGGYVILIKGVRDGGQLEASYFNPNPLPFAKAQATMQGGSLRVSFELQAGGYAGSTYDLTYDAATDQLKGVYHQAVAKQKYDIYFIRKNSGVIR
jgi:hypothetical protein